MLGERIEKYIFHVTLLLFMLLLFIGSHRFFGLSVSDDMIDYSEEAGRQTITCAINSAPLDDKRTEPDDQVSKRLKKNEPKKDWCSTTPSSVCGNRVPSDANGNILICSRYEQAVYQAFPPETGFS